MISNSTINAKIFDFLKIWRSHFIQFVTEGPKQNVLIIIRLKTSMIPN